MLSLQEWPELPRRPPLTVDTAMLLMEYMRKERWAIRGRETHESFYGLPSRFPSKPALYVGTADDARDPNLMRQLAIGGVLNVAPAQAPHGERLNAHDIYHAAGIEYGEIPNEDAEYNEEYPHLQACLSAVGMFIEAQHAEGRAVLVHCMAGQNRSPLLAIAYLMLRDRRPLFDVFGECIVVRPSILPWEPFRRQLCELALKEGLLQRPQWIDDLDGPWNMIDLADASTAQLKRMKATTRTKNASTLATA
eukprot:2610105-Prymnesium_polylepis.1